MFVKGIKEIAKLASDESIRPTLAGVYFKGRKIAVTDSFRLMEVTTNEYETSEVPRTQPVNFIPESLIDFTVPAVAFKNVVVPKAKGELAEVLNKGYFIDRKTDGERVSQVSMFTNDMKTEDIIQTRTINSKFPDYESFFGIDEVHHEVRLGVDNLLELLKAFKAIGHQDITMKFAESETQAVEIYGNEIPEVENTRAIIMPLKI